MKKLIIGFLILSFAAMFFMYKNSQDKADRREQEALAYEKKLENERQAEVQAKKDAIEQKKKKAILDADIQLLQSKYSMDYLEAKQVIESSTLSESDKQFYVGLASRWSDAIKVAGSTSRIALSQPVKDMQEIKRNLEAKQTSTFCESKMKGELIKSYDYAIDGFLQFMQKNELISDVFLQASKEFQENATALIDYC
ncbi:hypothetical protein [Acinetobacter sp. NIPH 298]|uniref:hypothetical protein n=1 Tax=Acinetobacter sp. NIPH 298 TaxID=1217692 RepID=UPI0002D0DEB1|nr:hypothetical protein [Acinetobacter sp. NIPH 298]ENW95784.1 hypothetical protein F903_01546 [Acinetobacter sp. NIPH 298]